MVKNLKLGKKITALILTGAIVAGSYGGFQLYKKNEVNRVKGYLEDFQTEQGYVDLSNISTSYNIKSFDGEALMKAMEELDVTYVRITDEYIYNLEEGEYFDGFTQKIAFNYNNLLGYDDNGNPVYEAFEPIRTIKGDKLVYLYPKGFTLTDIKVYEDFIDPDRLDDKKIKVNQYCEDSYSLTLK